jgi:hypothetical protein
VLSPTIGDSIEFGLAVVDQPLALTYNAFLGKATIWGGWNERIIYSDSHLALTATLLCFLLAWSLVFCFLDVFPSTTVVVCTGTILCCYIILWQVLDANLALRLQFVSKTKLLYYFPFLLTVLGLVVGGTVYLSLKIINLNAKTLNPSLNSNLQTHAILRKAGFDTLLGGALLALFIGRTGTCEETALCLLVVFIWTMFQLEGIWLLTGKPRFVLLCFFLSLYPLLAMCVVEPFAADFASGHSWLVGQFMIFLPPLLFGGYQSTIAPGREAGPKGS